MMGQISNEAWILLGIVLGDIAYTTLVVAVIPVACEANPLYLLLGKNMFLLFAVKILWTLPAIAFIEALRMYPGKFPRIFFKPIIPGRTSKAAIKPLFYIRICIVIYAAIFIAWHIAQILLI